MHEDGRCFIIFLNYFLAGLDKNLGLTSPPPVHEIYNKVLSIILLRLCVHVMYIIYRYLFQYIVHYARPRP